MRVCSPVASNCVIGPIPEQPANKAAHVDSTSRPSGVNAPIPVTTTRLVTLSHSLHCCAAGIIAQRAARGEVVAGARDHAPWLGYFFLPNMGNPVRSFSLTV